MVEELWYCGPLLPCTFLAAHRRLVRATTDWLNCFDFIWHLWNYLPSAILTKCYYSLYLSCHRYQLKWTDLAKSAQKWFTEHLKNCHCPANLLDLNYLETCVVNTKGKTNRTKVWMIWDCVKKNLNPQPSICMRQFCEILLKSAFLLTDVKSIHNCGSNYCVSGDFDKNEI